MCRRTTSGSPGLGFRQTFRDAGLGGGCDPWFLITTSVRSWAALFFFFWTGSFGFTEFREDFARFS
jgi:hypothetical protein